MPGKQVYLLGPPQVLINGQPVNIDRRLNRVLFYYVVSRGQPVARSKLLTFFWPEQPETKAKARLREALSRLGLMLPGFLQADRQHVRLNLEEVFVDQYRFEQLVQSIGQYPWQLPPYTTLPASLVARIQQAIHLWHGENYLDGISWPYSNELDEWFNLVSRQLESQLALLLLRLAEHHLAARDPGVCQDLIRKSLLVSSFEEHQSLQIIDQLVAEGKTREAQEFLRQIQKSYLQETELQETELQKAELQKADHDAFSTLHERDTRLSTVVPALQRINKSIHWKLNNHLVIPFVGRRDSLATLYQAFRNGGGIFILGESGIGKTRLVEEFFYQLHPKPAMLLATCRMGEQSLPYQPLIDLFRDSLSAVDWGKLSPTWIGHLSLLLPELSKFLVEKNLLKYRPSPDTPSTLVRTQLMESIRQVFLYQAANQKILLCLDDAQWADEATLDTMAYLLERSPLNKHLLIVLARSDEMTIALHKLINQALNTRSACLLNLRYLWRDEVEELLTLVTGKPAQQELIDYLSSASGCNPLYLVEILRTLQENPEPMEHYAASGIPLSTSLRSILTTRLQNLSPAAWDILQSASIVGMEFNPQILAEIDHLDPANLQVILNELENHQLIEKKVELSGGTRYRFIHSAIREVLLQEINPLRRQTIEFTTANRLEAHLPMGDGSQAAILAQHYEQGGKSVQAFEKWLQAGQYARQLFSTKEAELSFKRADELIDLLATLPVNSIYELFSEWTEIYLESENAEAIEQLSRRLEQIGRKRDNVFLVGTALNILCQAYLIRDQFETGQEVAKFALQMLEREPSSVALIDALCHFGVFSYMQGNFKQALQSFERAVQSAGSVTTKTERRVRANAYYQLSFVQAMMAIPSPAEKNAFLSLEDYLVINRPYGQCYAYSALVLSNYALGELTKALQFCNQGIELAQRIQATRILGYLHAYHSMIDFDRAELDSALEHAEQVISIGDLLHHSDITSLGFRMKADLFSFIAAEEAIHYYQIALPSSKTSFLYVDLLNRLGLINSLFRDKTKGLEQVETAMSLGKTTGLFSFSYQARISRLIIQLLDGDPQETIQLAYPIIEESRQRKLKSIELSGLWILGRAWLKSGDYPAAITCLTDLVDEASRIPYTWLVVQGLVDLHQALIQNGQADEIYPVILKAILDRTTQKIQKPGIREAFETYKTAILQAGK